MAHLKMTAVRPISHTLQITDRFTDFWKLIILISIINTCAHSIGHIRQKSTAVKRTRVWCALYGELWITAVNHTFSLPTASENKLLCGNSTADKLFPTIQIVCYQHGHIGVPVNNQNPTWMVHGSSLMTWYLSTNICYILSESSSPKQEAQPRHFS